MAKVRNAQLVEGPIGRLLVRKTAPMLIAVITMVAFNMADTYFISQLGTVELAALTFTFPVILTIVSLALGLGVGASAVISRAIGEGNQDRVRRLTTDSLVLSLLLVSVLSVIGLMTIDPVFTFLGASAEVMPHIHDYMSLWYVALIVVVIPMVGNQAITATGDTRTPAMIMLVAVTVNIVLDPIMIFGWGPVPAMGVRGAAIATAISRVATLIAALYVLRYREDMLSGKIPPLSEMLDSWKRVLMIGLPTAGTNALQPVSLGIITGMVAVYGEDAVAAFGVASRIETFGLALMFALGGTLTPFVGQNWGAGRMDRVKRGILYGEAFAVVWGFVLFGFLVVFARQVAGVFSDSEPVIEALMLYLYIVPLTYSFQGLLMVTGSAFNALNRAVHSTILTASRLFGLYVPLALVGAAWFGMGGIFGAASISNVIVGVAAFLWLRRVVHYIDTHPETSHEAPTVLARVRDTSEQNAVPAIAEAGD